MRQTPAQRHLARKQAAQANATAPPGGELQGSAYQLMLAQLAQHRRALKDIQSIERKIEAKKAFLPEYDAWVDGALSAGTGGQDLVLSTVMVWHIDAGNCERALEIARYAVAHALPLPDQYDRSLGTVLIDEFSTAALGAKMTHIQSMVLLPEVLQLTAELDAPDQARAKLHKALGYALLEKSAAADADLETVPLANATAALPHLQRALDLFSQVGVKKDIERLERHLKKMAPPAA